MAERFNCPRGTRDLFDCDVSVFQDIETICRSVFLHYGYQEIRTPIFESRELFERSVGGETDIVSKELYGFEDSKGKRFALRPEGTAGAVRAYIERNMAAKGGVTKLFYIGPMFRHERPQEGRYREFWQIGCELFGAKGIAAEVEMLDLSMKLLERFSIQASLKINHLGCAECREKFKADLVKHFSAEKEKLCDNCKTRLVKNPLRLLDCKSPICGEIIATAPPMILCSACSDNFERLQKLLTEFGLDYEIDKRLVRGLDYYTGLVFEVTSKGLGAQDAVLGGGRYDNLVKELGGSDVPAIGFALGMDRAAKLVKFEKEKSSSARPFIYFIGIGARGETEAIRLTGIMRRYYFEQTHSMSTRPEWIESSLNTKSLKAHLRDADRLESSYVVIVGEDEIAKESLIIREMAGGNQIDVPTNLSDSSKIVFDITSAIRRLIEDRR